MTFKEISFQSSSKKLDGSHKKSQLLRKCQMDMGLNSAQNCFKIKDCLKFSKAMKLSSVSFYVALRGSFDHYFQSYIFVQENWSCHIQQKIWKISFQEIRFYVEMDWCQKWKVVLWLQVLCSDNFCAFSKKTEI